MKNLPVFVCVLFLISCTTVEKDVGTQTTAPTVATEQEQVPDFSPVFRVPEVDGSYYYQALELLKTEHFEMLSAIDFVKFRYAYLKVRDRDRLSIPFELRETLRLSIENEDHAQVVRICDDILKYDFTDIYIHILRNFFLEQRGKDMSYYKTYVNQLIDSIFDSGDGRTPETAFHVIQIKEEYEILKFMGLSSRMQMLVEEGGHVFDVLTCENRNGEMIEVYFDITEHMQMLNQQYSDRQNP